MWENLHFKSNPSSRNLKLIFRCAARPAATTVATATTTTTTVTTATTVATATTAATVTVALQAVVKV